MTFQVANGSIPEVVERFLREDLRLDVGQRAWQPGWVLWAPTDIDGNLEAHPFPWFHDREPTLQEAIEAVMAGRG